MMDDDPAMPGVEMFAELRATLGSVCEATDRLRRRLDSSPIPVDVDTVGLDAVTGGVVPASGSLAFDLGSPDQGHRWKVMRVSVGNTTPTAAAAGRADLYVTPTNPLLTARSIVTWRDQITALPGSGWYGDRKLIVRAEDHLWVVVSTGTQGQTLGATMSAEDYEEASLGSAFSL